MTEGASSRSKLGNELYQPNSFFFEIYFQILMSNQKSFQIQITFADINAVT